MREELLQSAAKLSDVSMDIPIFMEFVKHEDSSSKLSEQG